AADSRRALTLSTAIAEVAPIGDLPPGIERENFARSAEVDIRPPLLVAALLLALADLVIAYALRGLLRRRPARIAAAILVAALLPLGAGARADDDFVLRATSELRLAYIRTGADKVDAVRPAGLVGLICMLNR